MKILITILVVFLLSCKAQKSSHHITTGDGKGLTGGIAWIGDSLTISAGKTIVGNDSLWRNLRTGTVTTPGTLLLAQDSCLHRTVSVTAMWCQTEPCNTMTCMTCKKSWKTW